MTDPQTPPDPNLEIFVRENDRAGLERLVGTTLDDLTDSGDHVAVVALAERALAADVSSLLSEAAVIHIRLLKAWALEETGRAAAAAGEYDNVITLAQASEAPRIVADRSCALFRRASLARVAGRPNEALEFLATLINPFTSTEAPATARPWVADGLLLAANMAADDHQFEPALVLYNQLLDAFAADPDADVRDAVGRGAISKAATLCEAGRIEDGIAAYSEAIDLAGSDRTLVATRIRALIGRAYWSHERGERVAALQDVRNAEELLEDSQPNAAALRNELRRVDEKVRA